MQAKRQPQTFIEDREFLSRQFIRLGDMMGDGLHLEPDGNWIPREYRRVAKALGYDMPSKKRANNSEEINKRMVERVTETSCSKCGGALEQTRLGSMKAKCSVCGAQFQLLKVSRRKGGDHA